MKFEKIKIMADIKAKFESIAARNKDTEDKSNAVMADRKKHITTEIYRDFNRFFREQDFEIQADEQGAKAIYKLFEVSLIAQEPGRRQEDITCIRRFLMTMTTTPQESYIIFIQPAQEQSQQTLQLGTATLPISPERLSLSTEVKKQLTDLDTFLGELDDVKAQFTDDQSLALFDQLSQSARNLHTAMISQRKILKEGSYVLFVAPAEEEWNQDALKQYKTIYAFLNHMNLDE